MNANHTDLIARLEDLYKQATEERSHFYTGKCVKEAIAALREQADTLTAANYQIRELRKLLNSEIAIADAAFSKLGFAP